MQHNFEEFLNTLSLEETKEYLLESYKITFCEYDELLGFKNPNIDDIKEYFRQKTEKIEERRREYRTNVTYGLNEDGARYS